MEKTTKDDEGNRCSYGFGFLFFSGIFMGIASLVPGISGGTVAFLLGFYDDLIDAIRSLKFRDLFLLRSDRLKAFSNIFSLRFLAPLCLGVVVAFLFFSSIFDYLLHQEKGRTLLYSFFFGLLFFSFCSCMKRVDRWNNRCLFLSFLGIVVLIAFNMSLWFLNREQFSLKMEKVCFQANSGRPLRNYDYSSKLITGVKKEEIWGMWLKGELASNSEIFDRNGEKIATGEALFIPFSFLIMHGKFFVTGILSSVAMLLPGISGSSFLVLLDLYPLLLGSLVDFARNLKHCSINFVSMILLANFALGFLSGLILFSRLISFLLKRYLQETNAFLVGLIGGAFPSIWPFWSYELHLNLLRLDGGPELYLKKPLFFSFPTPLLCQGLCLISIGFVIPFVLESVRYRQKTSSRELL